MIKFKAYDHIERWEGLSLKAYQDVKGVWTIGYGHTGKDVTPGAVITLERARELLDKDIKIAEDAVSKYVKVGINQNQADALISLTYNIGVGGFRGSTVLRRLNQGDYVGAANAILMWNKITRGGKKVFVQGLANRREAEKRLFLKPVEVIEVPTQLDLFKAAKIVEIEKLVDEFKIKLMQIVRS